MLLIALMIAGLSGQDTSSSAAGSPELYAAPVIRPYEPPSAFGRQIEEGDVARPIRSSPITGPVAVEAYRNNYEQTPSLGEVSYEQSVARARAVADARMGPLDGVWKATLADGTSVLDMVLSDRGAVKPVEGALSLAGKVSAATAGVSVVRSEGEAVIEASVEGRPVRLSLQRTAEGWTGTLSGLGRDQTVVLAHPR
ncbi:MAG TPA: hypothetical protein VF633_09525 [Brevundimonas sp.]|jgi:hypothetical protein